MRSAYQDITINILIIDDEKECNDALEQFIRMIPSCVTYTACSGKAGLDIMAANPIDIVFSDVDMPELSGIELIKLIKEKKYDAELILISGKADIINSINAMDSGIYDILTKPVDIYKIRDIIESVIADKRMNDRIDAEFINKLKNMEDTALLDIKDLSVSSFFHPDLGGIFLNNERMKSVYNKLKKLHDHADIPVLIEGSSGSGKEIAAKFVHYRGKPGKGPFIGVNCPAISRDLFESELFGYEKGAFTGAGNEGSEGYIKAADNGTLFLDEVSEIPVNLQAKLLRVIQEGEYYKVGGRKKENIGCRLIFATNRNLEKLVRKGMFRKDLYYRINVCKITMPSLNERKEEIIPLIGYFIEEQNRKLGKKILSIEAGFLKKALEREWKGNIRELHNLITNIILFSDDDVMKTASFVLSKDLSPGLKGIKTLETDNFEISEIPFDLNEFNKNIIKKTLKKFNGNKSKTAKFLNLNRIQMYKRFKTE